MKAEEVIPATHRLEHSGMTRNEAEAVVGEFQKVVAPLATKEDLSELGQSLRSEMKSMEESLRSDMQSMEESLRSDMQSMEKSLRSEMESIDESLRSELKSTDESLRSNLKSMESLMATKVDLANMEVRLFRSLLAAMLGVGALVLAILRFFPPL
ncbi:MAG: hypothetical protein F4Y58_01675 [Gammaproteobacteria bacterium]|nr:hypothetical protein [Gammaproteobacteria bacterium]